MPATARALRLLQRLEEDAAWRLLRAELMDAATLFAHRDVWVPEPNPATGEYAHLTDSERETLAVLRAERGVRLEQERIPWDVALGALVASVAGASRA